MAWLQQLPSGKFRISFRFGGRKYKRSLGTSDRRQAKSRKVRLEDTIRLVENGMAEIPAGGDVATFLMTEGKKVGKTLIKDCRLGDLIDKFFDGLREGSLEENSIKTMKTHCKQLNRLLGSRTYTSAISMLTLQGFINDRSKERGRRGRNVSAVTIRKGLATFRVIWNWGIDSELIEAVPFPSKGLRYPKVSERPPFQTFDLVVGKTKCLDEDSPQARDLWSTVFLNQQEIDELLNAIEAKTDLPAFVYPLFVAAAHTGARRNELMRSKMTDASAEVLTVREKKRRRGTLTTRRVPMSPRLRAAIVQWTTQRPAGANELFCHGGPSRCFSQDGEPISKDEMNHYFEKAIRGTKYCQLVGWHCLRHFFCSNCAAKGIDQGIIDAWVGPTTDEMCRRYRHLFPSSEKAAMQTVFGSAGSGVGRHSPPDR